MKRQDWVASLTYDVNPSIDEMQDWEETLQDWDGSVARIPDRGVDVTVYMPGDLGMTEVVNGAIGAIRYLTDADPIGVEIVREDEWQRRAAAPTMPELMSAAEIADELGVARQRVHQLRSTQAFPAPLAELRGGAVWDAVAVRKFAQDWDRKPGRPAKRVTGRPVKVTA